MGGAVVTRFMEESPLAGRVAGLVPGAPVLDWRRTLEFNATKMGLPGFLALPVEWTIDARIDADWGALDVFNHLQDLRLPILLFQGGEDELVPIDTSEQLAADLPRWVTYYRVPHAGHTQSWNVDPARYDERLRVFLDAALRPAKPAETPRARSKSGSS